MIQAYDAASYVEVSNRMKRRSKNWYEVMEHAAKEKEEETKMGNVLVIGNGYDLAHGLKTSYSDFLCFVKNYKQENYEVEDKINTEFEELIKNNSFIKYLLEINKTLDTWVDFEKELQRVTSVVFEYFSKPINMNKFREIEVDNIDKLTVKVLELFGILPKRMSGDKRRVLDPNYYDPVYKVHWDKIQTKLRVELEGLKRALILYLKHYMPIISNDENGCIKQLLSINPCYVISFNYTNTYTRYGIDNQSNNESQRKRKKVLHIHGDLDEEKIVLGYDDENKEELRFIAFKKYFQRIQYRLKRIERSHFFDNTGKKSGTVSHIYGMSLDKTDEDIIKEICNLSSKVIVYYLVKENGDMSDYENKVINLIGILGKDYFLEALDKETIIFREINGDKIEKLRKHQRNLLCCEEVQNSV